MVESSDGISRQHALAVAKFLRHCKLLKNRPGILDGKRVDFFKVKYALRVLQSSAYLHQRTPLMPNVAHQDDAIAVFRLLIQHALIRRVDKLSRRKDSRKKGPGKQPRRLRLNPQQDVKDDIYYVWLYDRIPLMAILLSMAILLLIFAIIVYPLWPLAMRRVVYYLSWGALGLIVLLIIISLIRLILYILTMALVPPGIWLFPNLYEDVGFIDSFKPLWDWHKEKQKNRRKKAAANVTIEQKENEKCN